jgi:hypothetical protein
LIYPVLSNAAERDLEIGRQIQASFLPEELRRLMQIANPARSRRFLTRLRWLANDGAGWVM